MGNASTGLLTIEPTTGTITSYTIALPVAQPTGGNTFLSCTAASPAVCTWAAPTVSSLALSAITGSAAQATATETATGHEWTYAGVETGNLTYPLVFQDTGSGSNTSGVLGLQTVTGTAMVPLIINEATASGDFADFWSGAAGFTSGVFSTTSGTKEFSFTAAGAFNAATSVSTGTAPTCTAGTGGVLCLGEGTAATTASAVDICYADSTYHQVLCAVNGGSFFPIELDATTTQTGTYSATVTDSTILCNSSTAFTVTLPASGLPTGKTYHVKNLSTGSCTVSASLGIDGGTTTILGRYQAVTLKYDGAQFWLF